MPEEDMQRQLTDDIFNQCKELQIRYCDCATIAQELLKLGWKKEEELKKEPQ